MQPERQFTEVRNHVDWLSLLSLAAPEVQADIERKIRAEQVDERNDNLPLFSQDVPPKGLP